MTMKILRISESSPDFSLHERTSPQSDSHLNPCSCFEMFHSLFSRMFYKVGYIVGKYPSYFIIIPFFISVLGLTGFQKIKYERDSDYLFSPTNGYSKLARDKIERLFPSNSSYLFDPSRISRATCFAKLYISAKDGDTMLRRKTWAEVVLLDHLIQNLTLDWHGKHYRYADLCSTWHGDCFQNNIYNLDELIPEVEDQKTWISYPIMIFPFVLPMFFGGVEINKTEGVLMSARALFTTYWLKHDDSKQRERAQLWEGKLLDLLSATEFETIHVDRYTSRSIPDELSRNNSELLTYLPFAFVLLLAFSVVSVASLDWVRSKVQVAMLGILTVVLAILASFGLLMYIGVPFIGINTAAPFLILGIGLDDMFVLLCAWRKTQIQDSVPSRLALTYSATAVSITVTSLTNMVAFFMGTLTLFPGVKIFCLYLGVSVVFTYLWFITFFGGCLAVVGRQEKRQGHALFCSRAKPKSETESSPWCYKVMCTGGVSQSDPWNPTDNKPCRISLFFKNQLGGALNYKAVKVSTLALYLVYMSGAIYGCFHITEGLDPKTLAVDDSYLANFYDMENENFRKFPYRIQVVIEGNVSYSDKSTRRAVIQLHRALENLTYVGPRLYTRSWIRGFWGFLARRKRIGGNITDEPSFIHALNENFIDPVMKESLDIVYNEDQTKILASRFIIQGYEIKDWEEDKDMIQALREVADSSPLDVFVYHPSFVLYDQYLVVTKSTMKIVAVSSFIMTVVSFLFIPNPLSSMWVGVSILSIEAGVIGYMSLWGVRLDFVSMTNLIMSIGFSVDFSAHIVYAYVTSKFENSDEKLRECMYNMGFPIVQSGLSTILGVILFVIVPSYVYRTFFKIIFLVTIFGMMHALLVLPVLLSLTSQRLFKTKNSNNNVRLGKGADECDSKSCFNSCSSSVLKEERIRRKFQKQDSCCEASTFCRDSSLDGSNSVQSESLRSSKGSSASASAESEMAAGTSNGAYDGDGDDHDAIQVDRL